MLETFTEEPSVVPEVSLYFETKSFLHEPSNANPRNNGRYIFFMIVIFAFIINEPNPCQKSQTPNNEAHNQNKDSKAAPKRNFFPKREKAKKNSLK
jgi:hypothetical protein